jgi:hypothetical protein
LSQADLNSAAAVTPLLAPIVASTGASTGVNGAIARAAQATGVDFSYLLAQARLESSLNPTARATTSSAAGLYQFTKGTWGTMLARHGEALGLDPGGTTKPPASHAQLMALRYDPNAAAMMAAELAGDNTAALTTVLGRAPTSSELYLAHFLGTGGATRFLGALSTDPDQSAAALLPKAASANTSVFYDPTGAPRSVGAVMALIQTRMDNALGIGAGPGTSFPAAFAPSGDQGGLGAPPLVPLDQEPPTTGDPSTTSMSDTLRTAFGLATDNPDSAAAPAFVRSAYGRLQALGL